MKRPYELWLGCKTYGLKPEPVFQTTNLDDVRQWQNAIDQHDDCEFQLTAKVNGRRWKLPPKAPYQFPSHEQCDREYAEFQRDEFRIFDLRDANGDLVDRDLCLYRIVRHLLTLWINTKPMGGYLVRERVAHAEPLAIGDARG
jgi:hypothetical protein